MKLTAPNTALDKYDLPVVTYRTRSIISENESAIAPRRQILVGIAVLVLVTIIFFSFDANRNAAVAGFMFLISLAVVPLLIGWFIDMPKYYMTNPEYRVIEHQTFIRLRNGAPLLYHFAEGMELVFPYDKNLTFTTGTFHEWFASPPYVTWATAKGLPNPHVIVAGDVSGAIVPLAIHVGANADIANIHTALTKAYVTGFSANMRVIQQIVDAGNATSAAPAPDGRDPDKPSIL